MSARSLNKVQLIGNLTRDPELRYTPQGTAVCTLGLATNRSWVTESGEKKEDTEFHRLVAWNKLAELCSQLLFKGRKIFIEGRLQTRQWQAQDGAQRQTTEIVVSDMIILDSRRAPGQEVVAEGAVVEGVPIEETPEEIPVEEVAAQKEPAVETTKKTAKGSGTKAKAVKEEKATPTAESEEVKPEDIPF
ncbi:single-stranded DNA-binding protein [Candidatus Shapirobacteria bacterium CG_4_9_14_3_um_filter_39_13]|uniref:Single-stranded DNA-binding protein n=1 Tax=Candidatus Shapirobacteria bacterium CG_4_9_14_3_um_filter_39_13 TaxID=1974479 RepID=A0A2M7XMK7_9BACT|nr:MAG: single-stranded DNA-binding protein [Candidatus Shapirobacteria bacterium CG_4_9_14_3_um_filter_39_13]